MTKIFITIPWFVPAFRAGGPIQSVANLVREYHEGIEYYIFCGDTDLNGAELRNIEINKWVEYNDYSRVWYNGPDKISDNLVKQVELLKPNLLFIIGVFSWHFNIVPMVFCKGIKKILSTRGMLHPGALSQKKWKKKIYLRLFKLLEYHYKVSFHATDKEEADYIRDYFGHANVFTAGNFPNKISFLPVLPKDPGKLKLLTVALISPIKNILKVLEALALVTGEIEYNIFGPIKDEEYWDLCKEKIKLLPSNVTVVYHREIEPQKVKEALQETHVFILPSKSENFAHSIYEALSAGRPVITSHRTPWNNLKKSNSGINVNIEIYPQELSEAIDFFTMMDQEEMEKWSRQAYSYSEQAVNADQLRSDYKSIFISGTQMN